MRSNLKHRGVNFLAPTDLAASLGKRMTNKLDYLHTGLEPNGVLAKRKTFYQFLQPSFPEEIIKN